MISHIERAPGTRKRTPTIAGAVLLFLTAAGSLFGATVYPQNTSLDRYTIVPPLGEVRSIAASTVNLFAVSDDNILVFDKSTLKLERTYSFDDRVGLIAYDLWFDDLWIAGEQGLYRLNLSSGMIREYVLSRRIRAIGVGIEYLYLETDTRLKFQFNRTTGGLQAIVSFPADLRWFRSTAEGDARKYPMLNPFYYMDDLDASQTPFVHFPISAIYDDGTELFVGTNGYGLIRYSTITWSRDRIVYGPIDARITRAGKIGDKLYFLSPRGISMLTAVVDGEPLRWTYLRTLQEIGAVINVGDRVIVGTGTQLAWLNGTLLFPIAAFDNRILAVTADREGIYIGTADGMFGLLANSTEPFEFGPDRRPVYAVYSTDDYVYAGGDLALYRYDRRASKWSKLINRGIKNIVPVKDGLYLLSVDNQLIAYKDRGGVDTLGSDPGDTANVNWVLLPYFNVYGIDSDGEILYCASYAGAAYIDPADQLYKTIYNLPRIPYSAVFVNGGEIYAISGNGIYRLPVGLRD